MSSDPLRKECEELRIELSNADWWKRAEMLEVFAKRMRREGGQEAIKGVMRDIDKLPVAECDGEDFENILNLLRARADEVSR